MPRFASYGFNRSIISVQVDLLTGTSAREFMTDFIPGFNFVVEKVSYVVKTAHTGASASQTIRVVKGASTVAATKAVVVADTGTVGAVVDVPVTAANAVFGDTDTLTVDMTASGTAFTAGAGTINIVIRQLAQRAAV